MASIVRFMKYSVILVLLAVMTGCEGFDTLLDENELLQDDLMPEVIPASTSTVALNTMDLPVLSEVVVRFDDLTADQSKVREAFTPAEGSVEILITQDVTDELSTQCSIDCVKHVWHLPVAQDQPDGYRKLTITVYISDTPENARQSVSSLYKQFNVDADPQNGDSTEVYDLSTYDLPDHTWVADTGINYVLSTSRGPVVILLVTKLRGIQNVQPESEFDLLATLAELQLQKLSDAGYPPR